VVGDWLYWDLLGEERYESHQDGAIYAVDLSSYQKNKRVSKNMAITVLQTFVSKLEFECNL
jgi:hypothetical protein